MPFQGETADPNSAVTTLRDPIVAEAIMSYRLARENLVSPENVDGLVIEGTELPALPLTQVTRCIAIDGSRQETPIADDGLNVGFVRVGIVTMDLAAQREINAERFVDSARLHRADSGKTISYLMPGVGICTDDVHGNPMNAPDTWRLACDRMLAKCNVDGFTLADALLTLHGDPADPETKLPVNRCPGCEAYADNGTAVGFVGRDGGGCTSCGFELMLADHLGVDDMLATYGRDNSLNMLMDIAERMSLVAVIETMRRDDPSALGSTLIVCDGPLSAIRTIQKLVKPLTAYLDDVASELEDAGLAPMLLVGVEKSGQFVEHAMTVGHLIKPGQVMALSAKYISTHVTGRAAQRNTYGSGHMYGRRFFYRRTDGHLMVLTVPARAGVAPWSPNPVSESFDSYPCLGTVVSMMDEQRSTRFPGAINPLIFAHKYASLALSSSGALARMSQEMLGLTQNTRLRAVHAGRGR